MTSPTPAQDAVKKSSEQLTRATVDPRIVSVDGEAERLWRHVLFGTGTCVGMIAGYVEIDMPGDPLPQLEALANRLSQIIETVKGKQHDRHCAPNE